MAKFEKGNKIAKKKDINNNNIFNFEAPIDLAPISNRINFSKNEDFIRQGSNNLFANEIAALNRNVSNQRAILNSKKIYIGGKKFATENDNFEKYIKNANKEESLRDVHLKLIFDDLSQGNSYILIETDRRKSFVQIYQLDPTNCRVGKNKDIITNPNWVNRDEKNDTTISLFPNFTKLDKHYYAVIHIKDYEQEFYYYGVPNWYAAWKPANITGLINSHNENNLENNHNISGMLVVPGIKSPESAKKMDTKIKGYTGVDGENSGGLLTHYLSPAQNGEKSEKAELIDFRRKLEGSWTELTDISYNQLIKIHNWYDSLMGTPKSGQLGNVQELINTYNLALSTVITDKQEQYIDIYTKIYEFFGIDAELSIINKSPVPITARININKLLTRRQALGLLGIEYDENQEGLDKYIE
jgi:hypothetical protein